MSGGALLRVHEAAALLGVSASTLRRWDRSGVLRARRHPVSGYRVYDADALRTWMERAEATTDGAPEAAIAPAELHLVGRDAELRRIDELVLETGASLVTLVGPPGVGKTRLARAWAERRRSDHRPIHVCEIGGCRTVEELASAIAEALGLRLQPRASGGLEDELASALAVRSGVLVLDEAEALGERAVRAIGILARRLRGLALIATSRVRLGLSAEHVVVIEPLAYPEAAERIETLARAPSVALFLERARAVSGLAVVDDDVLRDVAAITRRLEGLPLAIELAASRTASIGVARLRRDLEDSLDSLGEGTLDAAPHRRTLRAAIASSIERLDDRTRALLRSASCLAGGFALEDLEAIVGPGEHGTAAGVRTLVDHSLLSARQARDHAAELRFGMHAVVREIAAEGLAPDRRAELDARHAAWRGEQARVLAGDRSTRALQRIARDEAGLRSAWRWAMGCGAPGAPLAVELARVLGRLIDARGPLPDLVEMLDRTAALARPAQAPGRADLECWRARARFELADIDGARSTYVEALSIAREERDATAEILALTQLAMLAVRANRTDDAEQHVAEAERRGSTIRDPWTGALLVGTRAQLHFRRGERRAARRALERCRVLSARAGDRVEEAVTLGILGNLAHDEGSLDDALRAYRASVEMLLAASASAPEGIFRGYLATALHEQGDEPGARAAYDAALAVLHETRSTRFEALFGAARGALTARGGEIDAAARDLDAAETLAEGESALAVVALHRGHLDLARADEAGRRGDVDAGDRAIAEACRRVAAVDPALVRSSDDVRFAQRLLVRGARARLAARDTDRATGLVVGWEGAWIARDGAHVDLSSKRILRRIAWELALRRLSEPGVAIDALSLVSLAWPGERLIPAAAAHRLHVALSTLRRLGLRDAVRTDADGWLLDPELEVRLSSALRIERD